MTYSMQKAILVDLLEIEPINSGVEDILYITKSISFDNSECVVGFHSVNVLSWS